MSPNNPSQSAHEESPGWRQAIQSLLKTIGLEQVPFSTDPSVGVPSSSEDDIQHQAVRNDPPLQEGVQTLPTNLAEACKEWRRVRDEDLHFTDSDSLPGDSAMYSSASYGAAAPMPLYRRLLGFTGRQNSTTCEANRQVDDRRNPELIRAGEQLYEHAIRQLLLNETSDPQSSDTTPAKESHVCEPTIKGDKINLPQAYQHPFSRTDVTEDTKHPVEEVVTNVKSSLQPSMTTAIDEQYTSSNDLDILEAYYEAARSRGILEQRLVDLDYHEQARLEARALDEEQEISHSWRDNSSLALSTSSITSGELDFEQRREAVAEQLDRQILLQDLLRERCQDAGIDIREFRSPSTSSDGPGGLFDDSDSITRSWLDQIIQKPDHIYELPNGEIIEAITQDQQMNVSPRVRAIGPDAMAPKLESWLDELDPYAPPLAQGPYEAPEELDELDSTSPAGEPPPISPIEELSGPGFGVSQMV